MAEVSKKKILFLICIIIVAISLGTLLLHKNAMLGLTRKVEVQKYNTSNYETPEKVAILIQILSKYFKDNVTLHIGYLRSIINVRASTLENGIGMRLIHQSFMYEFNNLTISHEYSKTISIFLLNCSNITVIRNISGSISKTLLYNLTYVEYVNLRTKLGYICVKGCIVSTYPIKMKYCVPGVCIKGNVIHTLYDFQRILYSILNKIVEQEFYKINKTYFINSIKKINYYHIITKEIISMSDYFGVKMNYILNEVKKIYNKHNITWRINIIVSKFTTNPISFHVEGALYYVNSSLYSKVLFNVIGENIIYFLNVDITNTVKKFVDNCKFVNIKDILHNTSTIHILYIIQTVRSLPLPLSLLHVLNIPVELTLIMILT